MKIHKDRGDTLKPNSTKFNKKRELCISSGWKLIRPLSPVKDQLTTNRKEKQLEDIRKWFEDECKEKNQAAGGH